jgi:hypothetical protein
VAQNNTLRRCIGEHTRLAQLQTSVQHFPSRNSPCSHNSPPRPHPPTTRHRRNIRRPAARETGEAAASREAEIRRYVEEALLGPVSPGLAPLLSRETALYSLLFREGTAYISLSQAAAEGPDCFRGLCALNAGIRRNFPSVRDVRIFVEGKEAYYERFRELFTANSGKSPKSA